MLTCQVTVGPGKLFLSLPLGKNMWKSFLRAHVVLSSSGKMAPLHTPTCPVRPSSRTVRGCWWWSLGCWCSISYRPRLGNAQSQGSRPKDRPCCTGRSEAGGGSRSSRQAVFRGSAFPGAPIWFRALVPLASVLGLLSPQPAAHPLCMVALAAPALLGIDFPRPLFTPAPLP